MRVVLDSNVLIAAVAGRGLCEAVLELCLEEHDLVVSEEVLDEVHRNLVKRIRLPEDVAADFCRLLRAYGTLETPAVLPPDACRDRDDIHLLGLSQTAGADVLVTGDKDLLECGWGGVTRILTPRQFWQKCVALAGRTDRQEHRGRFATLRGTLKGGRTTRQWMDETRE